jgi:hypothetical protein
MCRHVSWKIETAAAGRQQADEERSGSGAESFGQTLSDEKGKDLPCRSGGDPNEHVDLDHPDGGHELVPPAPEKRACDLSRQRIDVVRQYLTTGRQTPRSRLAGDRCAGRRDPIIPWPRCGQTDGRQEGLSIC